MIKYMSDFLNWYASHNTLIIQGLAALIALLIIIFIFRLFFTNEVSEISGHSVTYDQLENKLNKLLEQQSLMKASLSNVTAKKENIDSLDADVLGVLSGDPDIEAASRAALNKRAGIETALVAAAGDSTSASTTVASADQQAELEKLRSEITILKDSLQKKETEVIAAKEQAQQSANTSQQDVKLGDLDGKIADYEKQIEALKQRLSDYEIIAEDIADLQRYKKENLELKGQIPTAPSESAPAESAPTEATSVAVAAPVENALPETSVAEELNTPEGKEVSKDVSQEDKVLLDEFEKNFAKDED